MTTKHLFSLAVAGLIATACVDSVGTASDSAVQDPLAATFENLARQASSSGDPARAAGYSYAAVAARSGIAPGQLVLSDGTRTETYDAFVNMIAWQLSGAQPVIPAHRSIVAWRRGTDGIIRMLHLSTPSDSAAVLHPLSMSPSAPVAAMFGGANGVYHEVPVNSLSTNSTYTGTLWAATAGFAKVRETQAGSACPSSANGPVPKGVTCTQSRFAVQFDITLVEMSVPPYQLKAGGTARRFAATAQSLPGFKLTFTCVTPQASGC